jgi:mannose-6-phosphate isomerase-like protein (cupin superfamily)
MSIIISPSTSTAPAAAANHPFRALSDSGEGQTFTMLGAPMRIVAGAVHTTIRLIAGAADTMGRFCVFEQETPAGWAPPRHIHMHEDEIVYILAGTYEVSFGAEHRTLSAGGCAILPRGVAHSIRNVGPNAGRLLCVVTPGGGILHGARQEIDTAHRRATGGHGKALRCDCASGWDVVTWRQAATCTDVEAFLDCGRPWRPASAGRHAI